MIKRNCMKVYMALERKDNVAMHDALDKLNEQKILLVTDFLTSGSRLLQYPKVFLTFSLKSHDLIRKTVECRPSATCPHFQFGSDVWTLDTGTGDMELQWTLPHINEKAERKDLERFLDEDHAMHDPLCVESVRAVLNGDIPRYTKFYNENFPYSDITRRLHIQTYGIPPGEQPRPTKKKE